MGQLRVLIEEGQVTDPDTPRGRLLDCAAQLFLEKGYERTTVRDIGNAVGIQSGSIFHHFKSKEEILRALMTEALTYFTEKLRHAIGQHDTVEQRLLACIRSELQFTIGPDTVAAMSVLISEWRCLSPPHQSDILTQRATYEALWMEVLTEARDGGLVAGDIFIIRRLLAGAINWTPNWYRPGGTLSLDDLAYETLQLVCTPEGG